jgi:hypothetical protein
MILKALTLENFKGIREPVRVELAPVTLLFGPNNAGKSTVIQALIYAREVFERNNTDAGRTKLGGDIIDMGGFKNLVYSHDLSRRIRIRFELDLSQTGLPNYSDDVRDNELEGTVHNHQYGNPNEWINTRTAQEVAKDLPYVWVEIVIGWHESLMRPVVKTYRVGQNNKAYASIDIQETGEWAFLSHFDFGSKPFGETVSMTMPHVDVSEILGEQVEIALPIESSLEIGWLKDVFESLVVSDSIPGAGNCGQMPLILKGTALPEWGRRLDFPSAIWSPYDKFHGNDHWEFPFFAQEYLKDLLTSVITGPGERLLEALKKSIYLSPFREMPPRHYQPAHSPESRRWANGLAAWDWLMLEGKPLVGKVNEWLAGQDRLNAGYRIEVTHYKELDVDSPLMQALSHAEPPDEQTWLRQQLDSLPEGRRLQIRDARTGVALFPQDLGVGISQVVPVLVAALHNTGGVVAIEEPESNIHPAFQVVLADLFITQAQANPAVMFLVETHSEHLMLRCLRRIRETTKRNECLEGVPCLTPEGIAVHFVEITQDGPRIHRIEIDKDGDFMDEWPGGFFEESFHEKFAGR